MKYKLRHHPNYCDYFSNGCGPKGLGWLIPDKYLGVDFGPACDIHDWDYLWGKTEKAKKEADFRFVKNMFRLVARSKLMATQCPKTLKRLRQKRAMLYYKAVRDFGSKSFWEGKHIWAMTNN